LKEVEKVREKESKLLKRKERFNLSRYERYAKIISKSRDKFIGN
jgi:hypothetical protein